MAQTLDARSWQAIVQQLKRKKCTPLLSNQIGFSDLFAHNIITAWAEEIGYPLSDNSHLPQVAQFLNSQSNDSNITKDDYLDFLKRRLLEQRMDEWPAAQQGYLTAVEDELADLTVSQVVTRLNYLNFEQLDDHPLRLLASLDMPLYLTTSHHDFIEMALKSVGKEPQTEICSWQEALSSLENITLSVATPLVYHLHGHDSDTANLVLTEDDHFDFLVAIAKNFDQIIPNVVMRALSDSSLILLGYQLASWEFRVIFRGLIKEKANDRRPKSVSIQVGLDDMPDPAMAEEFVRNYFKGHRFEVYSGDMTAFVQQLWQEAKK